ncbi:MAG: putative toxin-antitoxin system toxin component, PIN family [Deltaproteobacteria bacterium]|nr:putative toxin-antitoxin system toxin component, PIN family [Deltaproteobacteria bacterium]
MKKPKLRFVLDTNIIIIAMCFERSSAFTVLQKAVVNTILMSGVVAAETEEVFHRKKFDRYTSLPKRNKVFFDLMKQAVWVRPGEKITACRDPNDDKFLELAVEGNADFLITLDKDLLVLNPFEGIPILTPHEFLQGRF